VHSPAIGVFVPQPEIGDDPAEIRRFVVRLEELGFQHLLAYDHVVHRARRPDTGNHEPFALLAFLAGLTQRMRLMASVVILPQRQTALVAKQAATVDLLSDGRLTLGVGIGWNALEFDALNEPFHNRARRFEEQIALLRALWTGAVTFQGEWHTVEDAGIQPLPLQQPIPLWIGGDAEPALRRGARLGDGFFVNTPAGPEAAHQLAILHDELERCGRAPDAFALDGKIEVGDDDPARWQREYAWWQAQGVSQVSLVTTAGVGEIDAHLRQLEAALTALRRL
jgi:probable F420-dependent oxidoreductase